MYELPVGLRVGGFEGVDRLMEMGLLSALSTGGAGVCLSAKPFATRFFGRLELVTVGGVFVVGYLLVCGRT